MRSVSRAITMISAMSIVLLLGDCSKEEEPVPSEAILGKWNINSDVSIKMGSQSLVDYLISLGLTPENAQVEAELTESSYEFIDGGTLEFRTGGIYKTFTGGHRNSGTWEVTSDGKTLTMDKDTANEIFFAVNTLTVTNVNMATERIIGVMTVHMEMALTK